MFVYSCFYFMYIYDNSLFFFLMLLRPPISILFPYTTLFRSLKLALGDALVADPVDLAEQRCLGEIELSRDRKSTRLNSSHGYISYAVFCLKKKKKVADDTMSDII